MTADCRSRLSRRRSASRDDPLLRRLLARYRAEYRRQRALANRTDPYGIYVVAAEVSSRRLQALRGQILGRLGDNVDPNHAAERPP